LRSEVDYSISREISKEEAREINQTARGHPALKGRGMLRAARLG